MVEIFPFHSFENKFDGTTFHNQMSRMLKWEAEDIVSKIRVSLEVNTKYFLI